MRSNLTSFYIFLFLISLKLCLSWRGKTPRPCHGSGASRWLHLQCDGGLWAYAAPQLRAEAPSGLRAGFFLLLTTVQKLNELSSFLLLLDNGPLLSVRQSQVAAFCKKFRPSGQMDTSGTGWPKN